MKPEKYKLYNIKSYADCYSVKDLPLEAIGIYLGNTELDADNRNNILYQFMIGLETNHWLYESEIISELK
jgi:hypothetical protein